MGLKKDTIITFSTYVLQLGLGLISTIIIARTFGPQGKGLFSLLTLTAGILVMTSNLGLGIAGTYFIARKKYQVKDLAGNYFYLAFLLGALSALILFLLYPFLKYSFLKGTEFTQLRPILVVIPFMLLNLYFSAILLGQNRIKSYNLANISALLAFLVFLVVLFVIGKLTITAVILVWAAGTITGSLVAFLLINPRENFLPKINLPSLRTSLSFGLKSYLANLMSFFNYRLDAFLVNFFLNIAQVGFYTLAVSMAELLWYLPNSISTVVFPRVSASDRESATRLTTTLCRNTLFLASLLAVIAALLARPLLVLLFTKRFLPTLVPFYLLLPGIIALSLGKVIASDLLGRGKPIYATFTSGTTLILTIVLDILLIPRLGIRGAALASSVAYVFVTFLAVLIFLYESGASLRETLVVNKDDLQLYLNWLKHPKVSQPVETNV